MKLFRILIVATLLHWSPLTRRTVIMKVILFSRTVSQRNAKRSAGLRVRPGRIAEFYTGEMMAGGCDVIDKMKREAQGYMGKNYDIYFNWSDAEIYCSELVWKLYHAVGIDICPLNPLRSYDLSHPIVKATMQKRYGNSIPLEEKMVAPGDLFVSPKLESVSIPDQLNPIRFPLLLHKTTCMRKHFTLLVAGALAMASCQNSPKQTASDSTATASTDRVFDGYYEASIPAASSPGRLVGLTLRPTNDAQMTTDYMNSTPEIVQMGNWSKADSGNILITLVTVGSGNPQKDSLLFRQDGETLIYLGDAYGSDGLSLTKKTPPAPAPKELLVWVKSEEECENGPGFGKVKCYSVQYGDRYLDDPELWEKLMGPIEGFTFEKGKLYLLKVNRVPHDPPRQDVGAYAYKLVETVKTEKAK